MAHFQRLIRALVALAFGLLIGGFSVAAFAVDNIIVGISDYSFCGGGLQGLVGTGWPPAPASSDFPALGPGSAGTPSGPPTMQSEGSGTYGGVSTLYQDWKQNYGSPTGQRVCRVWKGAAPTCPEGETWNPSTGQCESICEAGETWNGTECLECPAGQVKNPYTSLCQEECPKPPKSVGRLHTSSGNPICSFGCLQTRGAAPGGSTCVLSLDMGQTGGSSLICDYGYTGAFCGWIGEMGGGDDPPIPEPPGENEPPPPPPETEPTPPAPEPCPAGFESASVNGASVCVNSGPPVKNQNTTTTNTTTNNTTNNTTTNTTTTTTTNNVYNQESNTTTTTTTTTITETIINNTTGEVVGGGSTTTVEQETTPGNGVPEDTGGNGNGSGECDPASGECGGGSVWSAACGGEVRCEGDAIQCAIARLAHEDKCAQQAIREEAETFMEALGAVEPSEAKLAEALNTDGEFDFDISEAFQDAQQSYVTFASSCLPPLGFTFKGQTYTFNTGFICEIGDFVRLMLHLVAYMAVLRIVARAFG